MPEEKSSSTFSSGFSGGTMPIRVRSAQAAADAFVSGTGGAAKSYSDGVAAAGQRLARRRGRVR
jgi:hypothetical protein